MLDFGDYLLGTLALALLATSAWLGATAARRRLLPDFDGAPAHLATSVLALALLILVAEALGHGRAVRTTAISGRCWGHRRFNLEVPPAGHSSARTRDPEPRPPGAGRVRHRPAGGPRLHPRRPRFPLDRDDRLRLDLVPRPVRGRLPPERKHLGPALHRPPVPRLVLPGQCRNLPRGWDARLRPGHPLAAAEPRLVRRLPVRALGNRPPSRRRRLLGAPRGADPASAAPRRPGR